MKIPTTPQINRRLTRKVARLDTQIKQQEAFLKKLQEVGTLHEQKLAHIKLIELQYERKDIKQFLEVKC